jgi:serine protease
LSAWRSGIVGATGRASAVVAVLDTGITGHPDLVGRVLPGHDFVSDLPYANDGDGRDSDPSDPGDWVSAADLGSSRFSGCIEAKSSWHGTVIAGIVAALTDNGLGVAGINQAGRVLPVRVAGKCGAAVADIVDGMRWAAGLAVSGAPANANPARIINISFGSETGCGPEYQSAVDELRAHGVLVVAAAGNEHGAAGRPANCNGVIGVAALNRDGFKTHYSNFGAALAANGIATVGGDDSHGGAWGALLADNGLLTVWNAGITGPGTPDYAYLFGTSFAAPLVAGTLSLMLSVNPGLSADQLLAGLRASARPHAGSPLIGACSESNPGRCACSIASCGAGILDAEQAVRYAADPAGYVAPVRQPALIDNAELRQAAALGPDRPPNAIAAEQNTHPGGGAAGATWVLALALACASLLKGGLRRP